MMTKAEREELIQFLLKVMKDALDLVNSLVDMDDGGVLPGLLPSEVERERLVAARDERIH